MDDTGTRRNDLEVVEGRLAPAEELVALAVALVLDFDVALEGILATEEVGDDGVVDNQFGRSKRVDLLRVTAKLENSLTHRGKVNDAGNASEVLHDDAGRRELNLGVRLSLRVPRAKRVDLLGGDVLAVLGAQQVFEEDLEAERQLVVAVHRIDAEDVVLGAVHRKGVLGAEAVHCGHVVTPIKETHRLRAMGTSPNAARRHWCGQHEFYSAEFGLNNRSARAELSKLSLCRDTSSVGMEDA